MRRRRAASLLTPKSNCRALLVDELTRLCRNYKDEVDDLRTSVLKLRSTRRSETEYQTGPLIKVCRRFVSAPSGHARPSSSPSRHNRRPSFVAVATQPASRRLSPSRRNRGPVVRRRRDTIGVPSFVAVATQPASVVRRRRAARPEGAVRDDGGRRPVARSATTAVGDPWRGPRRRRSATRGRWAARPQLRRRLRWVARVARIDGLAPCIKEEGKIDSSGPPPRLLRFAPPS